MLRVAHTQGSALASAPLIVEKSLFQTTLMNIKESAQAISNPPNLANATGGYFKESNSILLSSNINNGSSTTPPLDLWIAPQNDSSVIAVKTLSKSKIQNKPAPFFTSIRSIDSSQDDRLPIMLSDPFDPDSLLSENNNFTKKAKEVFLARKAFHNDAAKQEADSSDDLEAIEKMIAEGTLEPQPNPTWEYLDDSVFPFEL